MNTGNHDAFNLTWKLNGYLNGTFQDLHARHLRPERQASAQHRIQLDTDIATLISG
jgi:phenol 2-monooxygenase (NADPH)